MILIRKPDVVVKVAVSVKDMTHTQTQIKLTNLQTKEVTTHPLTDVATNERAAIYKFYVIRNTTPVELPGITYLRLQDGVYGYEIGSEIGLLQIGVPELDKKVYTGQSNDNDVYYNG